MIAKISKDGKTLCHGLMFFYAICIKKKKNNRKHKEFGYTMT